MSGEFTCCRLGHPHGDPCDREALVLPLLGLYADIYAERNGKHADAYAFIEPVKSRLFPETFEYVHKGLDGTDATTTHVLFGDLIAAVEETIDRDADDKSARIKGFKPGTHAQRHRLHRIQHSRQASSRLADLTSMVRDSFRRVNVVSEADSGKASPAAAQPAAPPATELAGQRAGVRDF